MSALASTKMNTSPPAHHAPDRAASRLALLVKALDRGLEIGIGGTWLRLFQNGDIIRTPRGYFETDEPRLMCRVIRGNSNDGVYTDSSLEGGADLWLWLRTQASLLSDECVSKIAAACEIQNMGQQNIHAIQTKAGLQVKAASALGGHSNVFSLHQGRQKS